MVNLGDVFPDFTADSTNGPMQFHSWLGNSWGVLFSHPADFTPVCTTELARLVKLYPKFEERNVKIAALSCDTAERHRAWFDDIKKYAGCSEMPFPYPILADEDRKLAVELGMIDPAEKDSAGLPLTARAVFIIDPDKKMRLSLLYPATTGRNFDEILRVIDSLQLTDKYQVATPADWKQKEPVMVQPSVPQESAEKLFPMMVTLPLPSGLKYLRKTPQPQ